MCQQEFNIGWNVLSPNFILRPKVRLLRDLATKAKLLLTLVQAILEKRYGGSSPYKISQPEQNRFISILDNALYETIGFTFSDADVVNLDNHLHETDPQIVQQEVNNCNSGKRMFGPSRSCIVYLMWLKWGCRLQIWMYGAAGPININETAVSECTVWRARIERQPNFEVTAKVLCMAGTLQHWYPSCSKRFWQPSAGSPQRTERHFHNNSIRKVLFLIDQNINGSSSFHKNLWQLPFLRPQKVLSVDFVLLWLVIVVTVHINGLAASTGCLTNAKP
jgi:hypothetical protein